MLNVGAAREAINPEPGHKLAGYGDDYPNEGVHDDIAATAVYFDDGQNKAVFINYDLIGIRAELNAQIRSAVAEKTGLAVDRVFLACTHTHSGPEVRSRRVDSPGKTAYIESLVRKSASAAAAAKANAEPCELYYNFAFAAENMNRRYNFPDRRSQYTPQNKQLAGTSSEFVDRELGIIAFRKKGTPNKYKALITIYTAHPLNVGNSSNLVSADYQGVIRRTIEETFAGCTVLSLTGAAGDHHPLMPESGFAQAEKMGKALGSLALARTYDAIKVEYDTTVRTLWREITLPARDEKSTNLLPESVDRDSYKLWYKDLPPELKLNIALLGIGPILLVGAPGEIVAELGTMIKWSTPFLKAYPLFQATDAAGYIPTSNQFLWGGYEAVMTAFAQGAGEKLVHEITAASHDLLAKNPLNLPARSAEVIGYGGK